MEFWGIEVKPGETVKVNPGDDYYLHVSQVALGETKKEKGNENIPIFLKHNDQKLVIGTLSAEKCAQIQFDFVFEKEFELSHTSKNTSIYFCGYKSLAVEDDGEGFDDEFDQSESDEEEDIELAPKENGKPEAKTKQEPITQKDLLAAKAKPKSEELKTDIKKTEGDEDDDSDDEDDEDEGEDEDSSDEDDLDEEMDDLDDDDSEDESDDEDEKTPVKVEQSKKRPASVSKTPVPEKKAKLLSPVGNQKSGDAGKKVPHTATPHPAKHGGKDKSAQKSPKSGGSISCKSCTKTFGSENALQAHAKAKHGDGK